VRYIGAIELYTTYPKMLIWKILGYKLNLKCKLRGITFFVCSGKKKENILILGIRNDKTVQYVIPLVQYPRGITYNNLLARCEAKTQYKWLHISKVEFWSYDFISTNLMWTKNSW
jgi:hypothetical protein